MRHSLVGSGCLAALTVLPLSGGCGQKEAGSVEDVRSALASLVSPPRGIYVQVPFEHALASGSVDTLVGRSRGPFFAGPGEPPLPIYLNRYGGTYSPGPDNSRNNTSIVPNQTRTVGGYQGSDAQWAQVVSCVEDMFSRFNAVIVEEEPAGGEYIESVIGGTPGQMGLPQGVGGVAPIDSFRCGIIPNAIVFTFSDVVGSDPQSTCEIAAQEIAHAISLDHELYCPDPMTYLSGCGAKEFRDYDAQCGEFSARSCNCGRQRQNSVQVLTEKLGTNTGQPPPPPPANDPNPPVVNFTSPQDGATLQQDSTITVTVDASDDVAIAATELVWQFSGSTFGCPISAGGGAVTCSRSGSTSTWNIRVGQGSRTFFARARDTAGNQSETPPITVQLGANQAPPNGDTVPPGAAVITPADGATLVANTTIQVSANVTDDVGLASVELVWTYAEESFPCPFNGQGMRCEQQGDTYTWSLSVGVGTRAFSVRARDLGGNAFETPERTITLSTDPEQPGEPGDDLVAEDNDRPEDAVPTRCGTAIDLVVSSDDEDWFAYEAPEGTLVDVGVSAAEGRVIGVEVFDAAADDKLAESADIIANGGVLSVTSRGPLVLARVTTPGGAVPYRLSATCTAPLDPPVAPPADADDALEDKDTPEVAVPTSSADPDAPSTATLNDLGGGCACDGSNAAGSLQAAWLLGLLLLLSRKRM